MVWQYQNQSKNLNAENVKEAVLKDLKVLNAEWIKKDAMKVLYNLGHDARVLESLKGADPERFRKDIMDTIQDGDAKVLKANLTWEMSHVVHLMQALKLNASHDTGQQNRPTYGFTPLNKPTKKDLAGKLTRGQFYSTQLAGAEYPETGRFYDTFKKGMYSCVICNQYLFSSNHKYLSKYKVASFYKVKGEVEEFYVPVLGINHLMCKNCGSHLGEVVIEESNKPYLGLVQKYRRGNRKIEPILDKGKRYLVNSDSVNFKKKRIIFD